MKNPFTTITPQEANDPNYEARTELIVGALDGIRGTRTIYVLKNTPTHSIPKIKLNLDDEGIAEARAHAESIRNELQGKS